MDYQDSIDVNLLQNLVPIRESRVARDVQFKTIFREQLSGL